MQEKIQIPINEEFQQICKEISEKNYSDVEWCNIESDDMFQKSEFVGGFDATEKAFTFSYYKDGNEYWFQVTLAEINKIYQGKKLEINGTLKNADT